MKRTYTRSSAGELAAAVNAGRVRPVQLVAAAEAVQARRQAGAAPLNAFISVDFGSAADAAIAQEEGLREAEAPRMLAGVPVAVSDNVSTADLPTTCGSRLLEAYRAPFDATVVHRLRAAGALLVGKTNVGEMGIGAGTEHSAFGPTRHPHDPARTAGGACGGSAAAVAAGIVPCAIASDAGGGLRQPAAFCGVVGFKPTYGMVSRYGMVAYAPSLDTVGTIARSVADAALLLECIAGHDPRDSTSPERDVAELRNALGQSVDRMTVGVPAEYFAADVHPGIASACRAALNRLKAAGATLRPIALPSSGHALAALQVIAAAEAFSSLARFDGVRFGTRAPRAQTAAAVWEQTRAMFGAEVKRTILLGALVLSEAERSRHLPRAQAVRARIAAEFARVFAEGVDAVFTPTSPLLPWRAGEAPDARSHAFTAAASLAGLPAITLPVGKVDGLPVGGQLIGAPWTEARLVRVADALERALAPSPSPVPAAV